MSDLFFNSTKMLKTFIFICFLFFTNMVFAQTPTTQDCLGAISICTETYSETVSASGAGNYPNEINGTSQGGICCMDAESNSTWYTFTVSESGLFGFVLTPNNITDDYDWALFDITNGSCADIYNDPSMQVSCNAAGGGSCNGVTGADGLSTYNNQGAGCNSPFPNQNSGSNAHNAFISVQQGNTYALVVSNWTGSTFGYSIDFGVSSNIGIIDNIAPEVTDVIPLGDCGGSTLEITFSEYILCNTISGSNFSITGQGGPYSAFVSANSCSQGGAYDNTFTLNISPPILEAGDYTFTLTPDAQSEILDLCGNSLPTFSYDFEVMTTPLTNVEIGNDTTLCEGETFTIDATTPNATTYEWQDGSTNPIYNVTESGQYTVSVTNPCNTLVDNILVNFVTLQVVDVDLGTDTTLCPGELYPLDATWNGAIEYTWQDGFDGAIYTVSEAGVYEVEILGACGEMGSAMVEVTYDETELSLDLGIDTLLCEEDGAFVLDASHVNALDYEWSNGSFSPSIQVNESGNYAVTISHNCKVLTDSIDIEFTNCTICEVYVPNAFSPNFDGYNDYFRPFSNCSLQNYSMKIFNRWGALVFESDDVESGWDGTFHNQDIAEGVYIYLLEFEVNQMSEVLSKQLTGDVTVVK